METVKIAIIGFGMIGSGVAEALEKQKMLLTARTGKVFEVARILDIRDFSLHPMRDKFVRSIDDILADGEISVVAEAIGGTEPAFSFVMKCLAAGKHVVTSNKELVAVKGAEILRAAEKNGVGFLFEAAVGGTAPIVGVMMQTLAANRIERIDGILNGTTNYMLTNMMNHNQSFSLALEAAQRRGYAETIDPSADIDGIDAQRKIAILASLAYGQALPPERVPAEGIRNVGDKDLPLADSAGGTIKLIASASGSAYGDISASVRPMFVKKGSSFYDVPGVYNLVRLKCDLAGEVEVYGRGAGKLPTAGAMAADIVELSTKRIERPPLWSDAPGAAERTKPNEPPESAYFVTACSENETEMQRLCEKVQPAAKEEGAVGFFTGRMPKKDLLELQRKLQKYGFRIRCYAVLEDE